MFEMNGDMDKKKKKKIKKKEKLEGMKREMDIVSKTNELFSKEEIKTVVVSNEMKWMYGSPLNAWISCLFCAVWI